MLEQEQTAQDIWRWWIFSESRLWIICSDEVVERAVGAPISQIFEENGEDAFRKLEVQRTSLLDVLECILPRPGSPFPVSCPLEPSRMCRLDWELSGVHQQSEELPTERA